MSGRKDWGCGKIYLPLQRIVSPPLAPSSSLRVRVAKVLIPPWRNNLSGEEREKEPYGPIWLSFDKVVRSILWYSVFLQLLSIFSSRSPVCVVNSLRGPSLSSGWMTWKETLLLTRACHYCIVGGKSLCLHSWRTGQWRLRCWGTAGRSPVCSRDHNCVRWERKICWD